MSRIYRLAAAACSALLVVLALAPAALAGSVSLGSHNLRTSAWSGSTSQGGHIVFSDSGGKIKGEIDWAARCADGAKLQGATDFHSTLHHGVFKASGKYKGPVKGHGKTYEGHFTAAIIGHVGAASSHGGFALKTTIYSKSGSRVTSCKTGGVSWKAHKG